jgi:hypothetical protein
VPSAWAAVPSSRSRPEFNKELSLTASHGYTPEQAERLRTIYERVVEARRELDALIGDAYLRPRASIVPVHFLDLASAVEKLRWAEKEWREIHKQIEQEQAREPERPKVEVPDLVSVER